MSFKGLIRISRAPVRRAPTSDPVSVTVLGGCRFFGELGTRPQCVRFGEWLPMT